MKFLSIPTTCHDLAKYLRHVDSIPTNCRCLFTHLDFIPTNYPSFLSHLDHIPTNNSPCFFTHLDSIPTNYHGFFTHPDHIPTHSCGFSTYLDAIPTTSLFWRFNRGGIMIPYPLLLLPSKASSFHTNCANMQPRVVIFNKDNILILHWLSNYMS